MAPEKAAGYFDPDDDWVREVIDLVADRAAHIVDHSEAAATKAELLGLIDDWVGHQADGDLPWSKRGRGPSPRRDDRWLIDPQEDDQPIDRRGVFVAPNSLREVEAEVPVFLLGMTG